MEDKEKSIKKDPRQTTALATKKDSLSINKQDGFNFDFGYDRIKQTLSLCESISQSGMVPRGYENAPKKVLVAAAMGARFGLDPLQSLQSIAVVNGNPTLYGDSLLGIVKNSSLEEWTIEGVKAMEFAMEASDIYKKWITHYEYKPSKIAFCVTKRAGEDDPHIQYYTIDQAKEGGLLSKDNWKKNPVRMLQMRARSFCLRDAYPDVLRGYKTYEEMNDVFDEEVQYNEPLPDSTGDFVDTEDWNDVSAEDVEDAIEDMQEDEEQEGDDFADSFDEEEEGKEDEVANDTDVSNEKEEGTTEPDAKSAKLTSLDMTAEDAIEQIHLINKLSPLYAFVDEELASKSDVARKTVLRAFYEREKELKKELSTKAPTSDGGLFDNENAEEDDASFEGIEGQE